MNGEDGKQCDGRICSTCYYRYVKPENIDIYCSKHKKVMHPWESCGEWTSIQEVHARIRRNKGKAILECRAC